MKQNLISDIMDTCYTLQLGFTSGHIFHIFCIISFYTNNRIDQYVRAYTMSNVVEKGRERKEKKRKENSHCCKMVVNNLVIENMKEYLIG